MTIKNSQIRAEARYLLDDNVLGKDWIKAAFMHFYADIHIFTIGAFMVTFAHSTVIPFLLTLFIDTNPVLEIGISLFVELLNLALLNVLIGPVSVGFASVYTDLVRGEGEINSPKFFSGFKNFFENFIIGMFYILQVSVWAAFLIVPGIYVAYSYALVFHVKHDHPEYRWKDCFDESERLMTGHRFDLFRLQISHLGWSILGILFMGIGTYWASAYRETSTAIFYEELLEERG
jgi:uncharacterized membrane protein